MYELSTNVDSLTSADKYLYVNTASPTAVPAGFAKVSCGDINTDLPLRTSDVQLGAASNLNGARRLLTVKTSDAQSYPLRRSTTGNEQQVFVTVTTPAGAANETFCKTSGITCMPGYVWKASYDTLKCADNAPSSACDHNYCCKEHAGSVHITNNAYHYSNQCNSLADSSTKRRLAFMSGLLIAILAVLVLVARSAVLMYRSAYCEEGAESNAPCRKPSLVAAAEVVSVIALLVAGLMGLLGQGSGEWIEVCGLDNSASWPVWGPLGAAGLLLLYFAMPYLHKSFHHEEEQAPRTARRATAVPMNIL